MRLCLTLLFVLATATSEPRRGYKTSYRYFKIACQSSNKTCINPFCYLKNTRNDSTFSTGCDIIAPVNKIFYQILVSYRFLSQYRYIFKYPLLELCSFFNLTKFLKSDNLDDADVPKIALYNVSFVKRIILETRNSVVNRFPDKLHSCPLHRDDVKFFNVSSHYKNFWESSFPDGDYRYEHKVWTDDDDTVFDVTIYERFKTGEDRFF